MKNRIRLAAGTAALFVLLTLTACMGEKGQGLFKGNRSSALQNLYKSSQAKRINEAGIALEVDGKRNRLSGKGLVIMSDDMKLLIRADALNDIFKCCVSWQDDGVDMSSHSEPDGSPDTDPDAGKTHLDFVEDSFIDAGQAAGALGYSLKWDEKERLMSLTSPQSRKKSLPASFDLRDEGRVSPVSDQGSWGSCWAFAAVSCVESALLPDRQIKLSEDHLVHKNGFSVEGEGGDYNMALAYMAAWRGPVKEEDDPYGDGVSPENAKPAVHLQDAVILNNRDFDQIKRLVRDYGAVQTSIYCPQDAQSLAQYYNRKAAAFYCPQSRECNHDVNIVGWDDSYPAGNFKPAAAHDGAFICKNSWGEGFGDSGYFYISYDDPNIGIYGAAATGVEDTDNYARICQSDLLGWTGSIGYDSPEAEFACVYRAEKGESLAAAGFYSTAPDSWYDIYAVPDFQGVSSLENASPVQSGYLAGKGYFTIKFDHPVKLAGGRKFALIVDIYTKGSKHPVAIEYRENKISQNADISDGESYMSSDGRDWTRTETDSDCNVCLKACTKKAGQ